MGASGCQDREGFVAQHRAGQAFNGRNDGLRLFFGAYTLQYFLQDQIGNRNFTFFFFVGLEQAA